MFLYPTSKSFKETVEVESDSKIDGFNSSFIKGY